jgi:hypothetical protein
MLWCGPRPSPLLTISSSSTVLLWAQLGFWKENKPSERIRILRNKQKQQQQQKKESKKRTEGL